MKELYVGGYVPSAGPAVDPEANPMAMYLQKLDLLEPADFPPITGDDKLRIIGLNGRARSGKDTVGNILKSRFQNVQTMSFADPLRAALRAMLGFDDRHFHGDLKEAVIPKFGKSPRQMMQTLGTDWGRVLVHPDLWLILAQERAEKALAEYQNVVFTDVRFENEASLIREMGGQVWHIKRNDAPAISGHASEAGIEFKTGDLLVYNNGTLRELEDNVVSLYENYE